MSLRRLTTNLRLLRSDRGWTQEFAAERCGMVMQVYQRLESGQRSIALATLDRLAEGFGVDPTVLLAAERAEETLARVAEPTGRHERDDDEDSARTES